MVYHYTKLSANTFREEELVGCILLDVDGSYKCLILKWSVPVYFAIQVNLSPSIFPGNLVKYPDVPLAEPGHSSNQGEELATHYALW